MTRSRATIALAVTVVVACIASMSVIAATSGKTTIEVTWYHPKGTPKYNVLAEITRRFEKQTGVAEIGRAHV